MSLPGGAADRAEGRGGLRRFRRRDVAHKLHPAACCCLFTVLPFSPAIVILFYHSVVLPLSHLTLIPVYSFIVLTSCTYCRIPLYSSYLLSLYYYTVIRRMQ